jgi:hypothetical protein
VKFKAKDAGRGNTFRVSETKWQRWEGSCCGCVDTISRQTIKAVNAEGRVNDNGVPPVGNGEAVDLQADTMILQILLRELNPTTKHWIWNWREE